MLDEAGSAIRLAFKLSDLRNGLAADRNRHLQITTLGRIELPAFGNWIAICVTPERYPSVIVGQFEFLGREAEACPASFDVGFLKCPKFEKSFAFFLGAARKPMPLAACEDHFCNIGDLDRSIDVFDINSDFRTQADGYRD